MFLAYADDSIDILHVQIKIGRRLKEAGIETIGDLVFAKPTELDHATKEKLLDGVELIGPSGTMHKHYGKPIFYDGIDSFYYDVPVQDLKVSNGTENAMIRNGIRYVSRLFMLDDDTIRGLPTVGHKAFKEIVDSRNTTFEKVEDEEGTLDPIKQFLDRIYTVLELEDKQQRMQIYDAIVTNITNTGYRVSMLNLEKNLPYIASQMKKKSFLQDLFKRLAPYGYFNYEKLKESYAYVFLSEEGYDDLIQRSMKLEVIEEYDEGMYAITCSTLLKEIEKITDESIKQMMLDRIEGETLEEIGAKHKLTKERIRQVTTNYLEDLPLVEEDRFIYAFTTYDFETKQFFAQCMHVDLYVYYYLDLLYHRGTKPLKEALEDPNIPLKYKQTIHEVAYRNQVLLNGEYVDKKFYPMMLYVMRNYYANKPGSDHEVYATYKKFIEDNDLLDCNLIKDERTMVNFLAASDKILANHHRRYRYYDIHKNNYDEFFATINFPQYNNVEISSRKIFIDNPSLMKEFDIHDEYELHNLIKKLNVEEKYNLKMCRNPTIQVGEVDLYEQALSLVKELSPISMYDLALAYEERYGLYHKTAATSRLHCLTQFKGRENNGLYTFSFVQIDDKYIEPLKKEFTEDFYFLIDAEEIFKETLPNVGVEYFNRYAIERIGYRHLGTYMIKDTFESATSYFTNLILNKEHFFFEDIPTKVRYLSSFSGIFYSLRETYGIIEINRHEFVTLAYLEKTYGITLEDIKKFNRYIEKHVGDECFTVDMIQDIINDHPFAKHNFDNCFYRTILRESKLFATWNKSNNIIFRKGDTRITIGMIIKEILQKQKDHRMGMRNLEWTIKKQYKVRFDYYDIAQAIDESSMYYDRVRSKVYLSYAGYHNHCIELLEKAKKEREERMRL